MRKIVIFLSILLAFCGGKSRTHRTPGPSKPENKSRIVLQIDDKNYTLRDFEVFLEGKRISTKKLPAAARSTLFNEFVNTRLLLYDAEKRKIILNPDEISVYRKILEDMDVKVDAAVLKSIYENLIMSKYESEVVFKGIRVTDQEAYEYYRGHPQEFIRRERVKLHHILVDSESLALQLREKLSKAGVREFETLAEKFSIAPEAKNGGRMGWYEKGDLPPEMENVVFSLSPGQISQVVKTPMGYHIFRLDKKEPQRMLSFAEVKAKIKEKLLEEKKEQALENWIESLKKIYRVTIYPENLGFPYKEEK